MISTRTVQDTQQVSSEFGSNKASRRAVVIGAGFSGISAACFLAASGWEVSVVEKNGTAGGRARKFNANGFLFDMGPSWYWMPDVFDRFFEQFGRKVSDFYDLKRLDPSYQVFFPKNEVATVPAQMADLEQFFEDKEPGSALKLRKFLTEAKYKYEVGMGEFVHKPSHSAMEYADTRILASVFRLQMFTSLATHVNKLFKNQHLREILKFPVLFLGATPENTPAMYSLMNYADLALGTWYPMGGMHKIVEGMVQVAKDLGVQFYFNEPIERLETSGKQVRKVISKTGAQFDADVIVGSADYHHLDTQVLANQHRNYSEKYWSKRTMAPSSLLFYLGVNKKINGLLHHNLFFDEDFAQHAREIYDAPQWPARPLFYVSAPSVTDNSVAPAGMENLFLLIPVAPGLQDSPEIQEKYFNLIMNRLEQRIGQEIRPHIVFKKAYSHSNFIEDYNAFKGNAYGLANTLLQTAFLKPKLKSKHLENFWFTGQLTTPGPGVPPSLISGEVVAKDIINSFQDEKKR